MAKSVLAGAELEAAAVDDAAEQSAVGHTEAGLA